MNPVILRVSVSYKPSMRDANGERPFVGAGHDCLWLIDAKSMKRHWPENNEMQDFFVEMAGRRFLRAAAAVQRERPGFALTHDRAGVSWASRAQWEPQTSQEP